MKLKLSNRLIKDEAEARGWKVKRVAEASSLLHYTSPDGQILKFTSTLPETTNPAQYTLAQEKHSFYKAMKKIGVNTPETSTYTHDSKAEDFLEEYSPLVIKPSDAAHGNGVVVGVSTKPEFYEAIELAGKVSENIIVQEQALGDDYRILFIGGEYAAASIRHPASVLGDGQSTVYKLIQQENLSDKRGSNYQKPLNYIDESAAGQYLGNKGLKEVPRLDQEVQVVGVSNIGAGGCAEDVTDTLDPMIKNMAQKITDYIGMDVCGVDIMSDGDNAWAIEVNASPSLGLHKMPTIGASQDVDKIFVDWMEQLAKTN